MSSGLRLPEHDITFDITKNSMEQAKNHEIELPDVPLFFLDILFKANVYSTPSASPTSTFGPVTPQGLHNRATWEITHSDKKSHIGVD